MDRDNRWARTQVAYEALTSGKGKYATSAFQAIKESYAQGKSDEFIEPIILDREGLIKDHDSVIFFNFRVDRPRQLTKVFVLPDFENIKPKKVFDPYAERYGLHVFEAPGGKETFVRKTVLKNLFFVTMTEYEKGLPVQVVFPPVSVGLPLARILSESNLRQLHIAESEKYPHVTIFFDGGREQPFPGEDWTEIPSPHVPTYDQKPDMSAYELTAEVIRRLESNIYDFILINYANSDMVGHTGNLQAGIKACECVDECLGKIVNTVTNLRGVCLITSDHGNVEEMIDPITGEIDTKHSRNPVPFILVSQHEYILKITSRGILADVAPTILNLFKIGKSELLTGKSLII
jgi:2,3-bisphosphoglycerate-independent phosphoglycerate mutase